MSTGPYDPCEEFVDDRDDDDTDLSDYDAGIDESPDVNDDGEIVSSSSDEEVRDFAAEDDRDVSDDDEDTTETRKTTLDQEGLDGENIFAGSNDENTEGITPYDPTDEFQNPYSYENADKDTPPTWSTTNKSPSRIRWECETGGTVRVESTHDEDTLHGGDAFDVKADTKPIAKGVDDRETAVEIAYAYMERNACLTDKEVYGDEALEDASTGPGAIAAEAEVDAFEVENYDADMPEVSDEEQKRQIEDHEDVNNVPYDPTADVDDVFGGDVPDEETREEVLAEENDGSVDDSQDVEESEESKNPIEVEFGSRDVANSLRDEHEQYLCPLDDRRKKTVAFVRDTPDEVLEDARAAAVETRADKTKDSYGQMGLTEREKGEIDFSENSVFHARTAKAIAAGEGVSNWLDYYDPTLTTDEHIEVYKNAEAASRLDSDELDDETVDEKLAEMEKTAESEECGHAERGCKDGYEEACEFLVDECGVDEDRVDNLLDEDDFEDVDADGLDTEIDAEDPPLEVRIALDRAWTGYRAGRADAKEGDVDGAREAREYAGIINAVRQALGQDLLEFEPAGEFDGGVVDPDDVGADFDASGLTPYDPTEDIAI
jgi:hypothetical protein